MIIIDTNILIYAVNTDAELHTRSRAWVEWILSGSTVVGLPWIVLVAFIRLVTNPRVMYSPLIADQALEYVDGWLQQPYANTPVPGEKHWLILRDLFKNSGTAGNLTNDAHIAAIAIEHGYTVYSADNDFKRFAGLEHVNPLEDEVHDTAGSYHPSPA